MILKRYSIGSSVIVVLFLGAFGMARPLLAQEKRPEVSDWVTASHKAVPAQAMPLIWGTTTAGADLLTPRGDAVFQWYSRPWWEYPLWGVPIGGALGLATFYVEDAIEPCQDGDMLSCKAGMVLYTVGGATIGGTLGALIGLVVLIKS